MVLCPRHPRLAKAGNMAIRREISSAFLGGQPETGRPKEKTELAKAQGRLKTIPDPVFYYGQSVMLHAGPDALAIISPVWLH